MFNYKITRLSCRAVFWFIFMAGTCLGGLGGLILGLMDRQLIGLLGGAFLALSFGLFSGFVGLLYAVIFNILVPLSGGIPVKLETMPQAAEPDAPSDTGIDMPGAGN